LCFFLKEVQFSLSATA